MNDSGTLAPMNYARDAKAPTSARRFRPSWLPSLAAALLVPLFVAAGQWQWHKAAIKAERQTQRDARARDHALPLSGEIAPADVLRDRTILARGVYEPEKQILLDNRIHQQRAGFHVLTPLRVDNSEVRILVNRGWVAGFPEHGTLPSIDTPTGPVEVRGVAVVPPERTFTLDSTPNGDMLTPVWQQLDLARYARLSGHALQPAVIQLDPASPAGGFVREWPRPDDKRLMNLGYALQWWSFAALTIVLWALHGWRRRA